jgi:hypothetical protein
MAATKTACETHPDRVVLASNGLLKHALAQLPDFRRKRDHAIRNVNAGFFFAPYGRVCEMESGLTKTRLFISYRPRFRRLALMRVAVVPDDISGLQRLELEIILAAFAPCQLRIVEMAIDFPWRKS